MKELHAPFAFDRQLLLADLINDLPWAYDLQSGLLSFGERFQWQAEVLGSESEATGTWLWAWANEDSHIPADRLRASLQLKALGEEHRIAELTEPVVPLAHADGHDFASIAVGEVLGKAYYRGPYEGGAAFLLITDERLQLQVDDPLQRVAAVFPQAISALDLPNHREALRAYLAHNGLHADDDGSALVVRTDTPGVLRAEFDERARLCKLNLLLGNRG